MSTRKKRSDRNHIIYLVTCIPTGQQYIGVTVMKGVARKRTLQQRWKAHVYKALTLREIWALPKAIRKHGEDNFTIETLQIVRGKLAAFAAEAQLINELCTELNTRRKLSA